MCSTHISLFFQIEKMAGTLETVGLSSFFVILYKEKK